MITSILKINSQSPATNNINQAAVLIKAGEVVAFPTETVYGLGADAFQPLAISKIFIAKNRPSDNPLIVHINHLNQLSDIVTTITDTAQKLIQAFWPGPLSIVFKKHIQVPNITTGQLDTVVVRFPSHPIAQALITAANCPLAAPSANTSGKISPTTAEHVVEDLTGKIPLILDGGPVEFGLESTVVDCTVNPPVILRPGSITQKMLRTVLPTIRAVTEDSLVRSPGMKYRHYAPTAPVLLFVGTTTATATVIQSYLATNTGQKIALLWHSHLNPELTSSQHKLSTNPAVAGPQLFSALRTLDSTQPDIILAQGYPNTDIGTALINRLQKAAQSIIKC